MKVGALFGRICCAPQGLLGQPGVPAPYIVRLRLKVAGLQAGVEIVNRPRHGYALVFVTDGAGPA